MKNVKIVIGANYGDEGKGLVTRHFAKEALNNGETSVVVFHNGTAQRGHTVDYNKNFRHVYHHFGSGTLDGAATFFADTFFIHPMSFRKEFEELKVVGANPVCFCDPNAKVITILDMITDHATEEHIAKLNGAREYGSCGYGSWCACETKEELGLPAYTISDFLNPQTVPYLMEQIWKDCLAVLAYRGVDIEKTSFSKFLTDRTIAIQNFMEDISFFIRNVRFIDFHSVWKNHSSIIFENGQGLGLDKDNGNWHTTSKTGMYNPYNMLNGMSEFDAEVCYVTRSYLTRHGVGPLEEAVRKSEINDAMHDRTNVPNEFQGSLRYGFIEDKDQANRITSDFSIVASDSHFKKEIVITHCNEFNCGNINTKYMSYSPYEINERV